MEEAKKSTLLLSNKTEAFLQYALDGLIKKGNKIIQIIESSDKPLVGRSTYLVFYSPSCKTNKKKEL